MNDRTSQPDSPPTAQRAHAEAPERERAPQQQQQQQQQREPRPKQDGHEPGARSSPRAPGGNRLNDIADADTDKVVPRDRDETKLHDHSLGDTDERDEPDAGGNIPRPL